MKKHNIYSSNSNNNNNNNNNNNSAELKRRKLLPSKVTRGLCKKRETVLVIKIEIKTLENLKTDLKTFTFNMRKNSS